MEGQCKVELDKNVTKISLTSINFVQILMFHFIVNFKFFQASP